MLNKLISLLNRISNKLRFVKLQTRLIISFLILSILPLSILGFISYRNFYKTLENNTVNYTGEQVEQLKHNIDNILEKYVVKVNEITTNLEIIKYVKDYKGMNNVEKSMAFTHIYTKLKDSTRAFKDLISMEILDMNETIANTQYRITASRIEDSKICQSALSSPRRINWFGTRKLEYYNNYGDSYRTDGSMAFIISTKVKNFTDGETVGLVNIALKETVLYSSFENINLQGKGYIYITDENGFVVSHHDKSRLSSVDDENITRKIQHIEESILKNSPQKRCFIQSIDNQKSLVSYSVSDITGWRIVSVINYNQLMSDVNSLGRIIVFILVLCAFFILSISFIVTNSVTIPVQRMVKAMGNIEESNFAVKVADESNDEISYLAKTFNQMVTRIHRLITEVYDVKLQQREAEFKALQSQINPHFLYNTLDSINWMAFISQHKEISIMVNSLAKFFRLSLNKGNEFYTIGQEVEHLKSYITVQEIRYRNKIKFHFDIMEEIYDHITIKILLQPLVENSIYHGIEPRGGYGNIWISIRKSEEKLLMQVSDDGIGFKDSDKDKDPLLKDHGGYGIKNIDERIKLYFGLQYGLEIHCSESGGTTAKIWIPAIKWKEAVLSDENPAGR